MHDGADRRARARDLWLVILLYGSLTLLLAYPLSLNPTTLRLPTGPDGDLCMWILAWDAHAFIHQPLAIFDANIYYPQHLTLAYAENLIGSALFAAPVLWLTGNLTLASNFVGLFSCLLCGVGAYVLARRLGVGLAGAVVSGLIFAFSPPRFFRIGQLHLAAVQWIPFGLSALHAYLDRGRKRDLRLAVGFFTLQALSSGYGAVFMSVSMAGLLAYRVVLGEPIRPFRRIRDLGLTGVVLLLPTVYVFLQYRAVQLDVGLRRGLGGWGVDPASFIASPSHLQRFVLSAFGAEGVYQAANAFLFPGYLPLLLAAAALLLRRRSFGTDARTWADIPDEIGSPTQSGSGELPRLAVGEPTERTSKGWKYPSQARNSPVGESPLAANSEQKVGALRDRRIGTAEPSPIPELPRGATSWARVAVLLDLLVLGTLTLAVVVGRSGPVKLRLWSVMLFSARNATRLWIACAILVAIRLALLRSAPFSVLRRVRQAWTRGVRMAAESWRLVVRVGRALRSIWRWLGTVRRRAVSAARNAVESMRRSTEPVRRRMSAFGERFAPVRRWADVRRRDTTIFYGLLTLLSYWLAVGPPYGLWQFVYWLPGFTFIRECSRFTIVGVLGLAILAGIGFDRLTGGLTMRRRVVMTLLAGTFLIAEFAAMPLAVQPTTAIVPAIDRWLDTQPKPFVVAEVPSPRPSQMGPFERQQAAFMIHSTAHWQKTMQGYSGWRTPLHEVLYWEMLDFPNDKLLDTLAGFGVTLIVVHTELYPEGEWAKVEGLIGRFTHWLTLVHVEGTGRVYALRRPAPGMSSPRANRGTP